MSDTSGGGFQFGNVGRDAKLSAGRNLVGRDMITQIGFAGEEQKQQFQSEIEQLREALRAMKGEIEASASLGQDKKDEVITEILQQEKALEEVKEKTAEVPPGEPAPANVAAEIAGVLDSAGSFVDKLQGLATKAGGVAETIGTFVMKYGPLVASARHLFGLP